MSNSKTIVLISNSIFYGLGLQKYIYDYKLENIPPQNFEGADLAELLQETDLVLVSSESAESDQIIELIKSITKTQIPVIYLSQNRDKSIFQLYSLGCQGIVEQQFVKEQLPIAIKAIKSGGTYYSQGLFEESYMVLLGPLFELFEELDQSLQKLTPREKEIATSYLKGLSLTDIMKQLGISKSTINSHMESIRLKFQVDSNRDIIKKYQLGSLNTVLLQ